MRGSGDFEIKSRNRRRRRCAVLANPLTKKAPYKGLGADSEEKREPAGDIDTAVVDGLKALDPNRPIREADLCTVATASLFDNLIGAEEDRSWYI